LLNEVPHRDAQMPPTDPLIYRFYELVMVNSPALKALIGAACKAGALRSIASPKPTANRHSRAAW
jgi:cyanate lyase